MTLANKLSAEVKNDVKRETTEIRPHYSNICCEEEHLSFLAFLILF